jgi:drug/metabolite transporter (DMT)-like permease
VVRDAIHGYPVLPFLGIRFTIAAVCLAPAVVRSLRGAAAGIVPGFALAGGYLAQSAGLKFTTASKAGLLTGLFVVITPLLGIVVWRRLASAATLAAAAGALIGTGMLLGAGAAQPGSQQLIGDTLEVLTALCFSIHILLLARFAPGREPARVAWTQMLVAAMLFSLTGQAAGQFRPPDSSVWLALVVTGVLASAVAFLVQTAVQQRISPSRTAIVLAAEPAFATLFGVILAGDRFGPLQGAGAALIVGAVGFHEWAAAQGGAAGVADSVPVPRDAETAPG